MHHDILYINGDSYSEPHDNFSVYGKILAEKRNKIYINRAIRGSSNDRIFRSTIEDSLAFNRRGQKIFALIGLSFVSRQEVWAPDSSNIEAISMFNNNSDCRLVTRDFLPKQQLSAYQTQSLVDEDINTQFAHFFYKLFMFANTLENLHIPYFIFSAANNVLSMSNLGYILGTESHNSLTKRNNIANMFEFSIPKWAEEHNIVTTSTGHLKNTEGHSKFADYLYENYLKSLWIQNK
jgi:hypothetical protein